MDRTRLGGLVLVLVALTLSGCSVAVDSYRGLPTDAEGTPLFTREETAGHPLTGEPLVSWLDDPDRFAVTLYGSSSCPPYPTGINGDADEQRISISTATTLWPICTADFGGTTYELVIPDEIDPSLDVTISFGENASITLPRRSEP